MTDCPVSYFTWQHFEQLQVYQVKAEGRTDTASNDILQRANCLSARFTEIN